MTKIFCTKKLEKFLGGDLLPAPDNYQPTGTGDWNGHIFYVDKRKCLAFVHNTSRYVIYFSDILKKDMKNFEQLFRERLKDQLVNDGIIKENDNKTAAALTAGLTFHQTNNDKKIIGTLNDFVYAFRVYCFEKYPHLNDMDVIYENGLINTTPVKIPGSTQKEWSNPVRLMREMLKREI